MHDILWVRARPRSKAVIIAIMVLAGLWIVVPLLWVTLNSVKTLADTFRSGAFIPFVQFRPTLDSWHQVLNDGGVLTALWNSILASVGNTVLVLIISIPAAYSLARFEFPIGSRDITLWFMSQRVLPPAVMLVPFYLMMVQFHLIDTMTGLIIAYSTVSMAFGVVIMRDVFRDIPKEIEEAAKIEGATPWQIFFKLALPLSRDGVIVTAVNLFAFGWNEALFANSFTSRDAQTLTAFILASRGTRDIDFNLLAVNTLIAIGPPIVLSFFLQRYLARGLAFGAVKG